MKLFSGTANPGLSEQIADHLNLRLSNVEIIRFENSEVRVRIQEDVKNDTCIIIQSVSNPTDTNLMELFLLCDALRREEAKRVIGIIPYFGYARQNIQHRDGECVSVNVIIRIMESIGFHKIFALDMHDEATAGVFSIPFKNLSTFPSLAESVKDYLQMDTPSAEEVAIVSPDQGGIERARKFGQTFFGSDDFHLAVTEKKRDLTHAHKSKALDLYGDVKDKTVIIVDDIATSAGTLIHSADLCERNGAKRVLAAVTHHDFSTKAPDIIQNSPLEVFFTTNTIRLQPEFEFPKLKEISVASLISKELALLK
jgi:ribose-phosphate pyrophosphokinase